MTAPALVPSPPQERTDRGVGASSAAAAIGVSEYRSRLDAWLEATGRVQPFAGNEKTRWGQVLEPVIRAHYVELHGVAVHVPPESLFHREFPFVRATPDGIVVDDGGAWQYIAPQVKNVGLRMAPAWADGTIPVDYMIQGVVEMAVTDLDRIDFAVLIGGQQYEERTLYRDPELEADVLEQLVEFWRLVETHTQPEIDESRAFRSHVLKQITKKATIEVSAKTLADLERWREVVIDIAKLKREEAVIKNRVVAEMAAANANKLTSPIGAVTIGAPIKKTAWKDVAQALRPLCTMFDRTHRELEELGAALAGERPDLAERVEMLRKQCTLGDLLSPDFDALVEAHTKQHDPRINRPRAWTADVDDDEEH